MPFVPIAILSPHCYIIMREIRIGTITFNDEGIHKILYVHCFCYFFIRDITSMVEIIKSIKIWIIRILGRAVIFITGHFHILVINIIVAGNIVFVGALTKFIDALINAIDVNNNRLVGLPVYFINICTEELLQDSIIQTRSFAIVSAISQHEGFHFGHLWFVMPEIALEILFAKAVLGVAFEALLRQVS